MRFITKAIVIIAVATGVLLSNTVDASVSSNHHSLTKSITNNINNNVNNQLSALHSQAVSSRSSLLSSLSSLSSLRFSIQTYQDCLGALSATTRTLDNVKGCLSVQGAASFDTNCKADINSAACAIDLNAASKLYGVGPTSPPGGSDLPQSCARAIAGGNPADSDACAKDLGLQSLPQSCLVKPPQMEKCITDVLRDLQNIGTTTTPAPTTPPPPMWIPKSCLIIPPSIDSVNRCATEFGITIPAVCQGTAFSVTQCSTELSTAIALKFTNNNNGGGASSSTQQCYQAIQSFSTNVNTKCKAIIDGLSSISSTNLGDIITNQCTLLSGSTYLECQSSFNTDAIVSVQNACPNYHFGQILASAHGVISIIQGPLAAMCIKDDQDPNKICLSSIVNGLSLFDQSFSIDKINNDILASMCKPCMMTIMNKIAALGGSIGGGSSLLPLSQSMKYLQLMCTKDPTDESKYCMNVFTPIKTAFAKMAEGAMPTDTDFNTMCSPCINTLLTKLSMMETINGIDIALLKSLQRFCVKDPISNNNAVCGTTIFSQQSALQNALFKCMGTECSTECRSAVQELYSTQSCCFSTVGMQSMIPIIKEVSALKSFLPQVTNAVSCQNLDTIINNKQCAIATTMIPLELTLKNIDATTANKALVNTLLSAALKKDLSLLFGIDSSAILIGAFSPITTNNNNNPNQNTNLGTKVLVTITIDSSFSVSYQSLFNTQLKRDDGIPLQNTAQTAEANQAKIIDNEPVSAQGQGGTTMTSAAMNNNNNINNINMLMMMMTMLALFFYRMI